MSERENYNYYSYLLKRTRLGLLYRRYYVYPRLIRFLQGKVLDVGCGIGDFLEYRADTVGVDVNPYNIEHCSKLGLNAHLIQNGHYPFVNQAFDGAIMDNVIEHLVDPVPVLEEIRRVLRPGGTLIVGTPGLRGYASDPDHKRFYNEETLLKIFEGKGFKLREMMYMPFRSSWLNKTTNKYCLYGVFSCAFSKGMV